MMSQTNYQVISSLLENHEMLEEKYKYMIT
jgi:hypothetical protein